MAKSQAVATASNGDADEARVVAIPLRRMTQAELDAFLERAADILRGNVDHSEFRGYVFALLFFKRISDIFEEAVRNLAKTLGDELANDPAMQKKSLPFVVPADCMWEAVTVGTAEKRVTSLQLGQSLNDAMLAIERANAPKFDGILTSKIDFNKTDELPRDKLVTLKNHFSGRKFDRAHVPDDLFGDAYEYLIRTFASKAGKSSGEFYTPKEVSYLMSEIIEPEEQHEVCDWSSGSASLLLQCREYLRRHKKDPNRLFLFAQESNLATYNISRINLILHGVNSWHPKHGDSLRDPKHKTSDGKLQQFDRVVMNPPFSLKDWGSDTFTDGDPFDRFSYGWPPGDNGDYAWMQHIAKSLKPAGKAIVVMSQGILFRGQPKLTEEEDGRNKKADDEYLIRSGFLRDDLIEAVIVLPSGIFYGNNVPACLTIINKRKPAARKNRVLMVWASRDCQHANPQSFLRRADCLRILLPWRAFGDSAKALKILPVEGKAILDEIAHDREHALKEISEAYDAVIAALPVLREESDSLSTDGFKAWQEKSDSAHPVWGKLANPKLDKASLKTLTKRLKDEAKARLIIMKAQIKVLEKLEKERDERIAEINRRADRESVEVQDAITDLQRICADPDEARRYFVVAEKGEIEENEFNLNLPRYVGTFEPEEEIELNVVLEELEDSIISSRTSHEKLRGILKLALDENGKTIGPPPNTNIKITKRYGYDFVASAEWEHVELRTLQPQIDYGTNQSSNDQRAGVPVIAIPQVLMSRFALGELPFAEVPEQERDSLALRPHDVLLVRTNGNPSYIGRSTVIPEQVLDGVTIFASYLIRIRLDGRRLSGAFLNYVLLSQTGRRQSNCLANTSAGNFNLGARSLSKFLVPLPKPEEQDQVVEAINAADDLVLDLEKQLAAARRVKESLLQNLVTGKIRLKP